MNDRLLTADEVMAMLRLKSRDALRTLRRQRRIEYIRIGYRSIVYPESKVEEFIHRNTHQAER